MTKKNDDHFFKNKAAAYIWLKDNQAPVSRATFYSVCAEGKIPVLPDNRVSRVEVSEYLRKLEAGRRQHVTSGSSAREDAETRKAIADATKAEIQAEEMQRALDKKWISREAADLETCTWASLTRDTIAARLNKNITAIIHAAGGDYNRIPDVQAIIDAAIIDACNDIANAQEVEVEFEALEED